MCHYKNNQLNIKEDNHGEDEGQKKLWDTQKTINKVATEVLPYQ